MLALLVAIAVLWGAFTPPAPVQQDTPPEIRVGDVAEIAGVDEVKDANAPNGTYVKTDNGWAFVPDTFTSAEGDAPPKAPVTASMTDETIETAGGALVLAVLGVFAWKMSGIGKRGKTRPGDSTSIELLSLVRRLDTMAQIMEGVAPDGESGGKKK